MEQIAAILLLLGCSDDGRVCTELHPRQANFDTEASCEAAVPDALRMAGEENPLALAKCVPFEPLADGQVDIVWHLNDRGELFASVVPYPGDEMPDDTVVATLAKAEKGTRLR